MKNLMNVLKAKVFYIILLVVALGSGFATRAYFIQQENVEQSKEHTQQVREQQALIKEERKKNEELKSKMTVAEARVTEISTNIKKAKDEHETNKANAVKNATNDVPVGTTNETVLDFIREKYWVKQLENGREATLELFFNDETSGDIESNNLIESGYALHNFSIVNSTSDSVTLNTKSIVSEYTSSVTIRKGRDGKTIDVSTGDLIYNLEPADY